MGLTSSSLCCISDPINSTIIEKRKHLHQSRSYQNKNNWIPTNNKRSSPSYPKLFDPQYTKSTQPIPRMVMTETGILNHTSRSHIEETNKGGDNNNNPHLIENIDDSDDEKDELTVQEKQIDENENANLLSPSDDSSIATSQYEIHNVPIDLQGNQNSNGTYSNSTMDIDNATQNDIHQQNETVPNYNEIYPGDDNEDLIDLTILQPDQYHAPGFKTLLSPRKPEFSNKKCLVLDLDETLVHSSFKYVRTADFVLPVEIEDQIHNVYVIKRPGVDEFLKRVGELYEVVVFTASVSRYGDPLLNILDQSNSVHHRLFREACYNYEGNYIKNLAQIGRPLSDIIILDNSPASYMFHPQHAIPISSWFSDTHDNELLDIIPLLEDLSHDSVLDVGKILDVTI
ncbi:hypothetical protein NCAS_0D02740 [Naumovozyma castellii]|uniref:FCP1 homology domain-containing protein n=1 Tax=Naumovozyma castellii TaxID=27288 RepID=G0VE64_NAUCA|nr:hypothetical protein NCAS_0D02740 [Naumovozyma castellii CBS 4309]CCC69855.1 hypothetical protein NCAS_0D02740 [Naumovozyma castellii CBS 4309]